MGIGRKKEAIVDRSADEIAANEILQQQYVADASIGVVDDSTNLNVVEVENTIPPATIGGSVEEAVEPAVESEADPFGWCKQDTTPGWQKALMVGIGVVAVGGIGFGIYKGVQYWKSRNSAPVDAECESNDGSNAAAALCAGLFGRR